MHDLENLPLPFEDRSFDEIHAYHILEHTGAQGDYKFFFAQFTEFARILRPGGFFLGEVPHFSGPWAWGDPSHRRIINLGTLQFLSQAAYSAQVGVTTMSDFRYLYKADFEILWGRVHDNNEVFAFVLRVNK